MGIDESMSKYDNLVIMGQDIAEYGGVFKVTEVLLKNMVKKEFLIHRFASQLFYLQHMVICRWL